MCYFFVTMGVARVAVAVSHSVCCVPCIRMRKSSATTATDQLCALTTLTRPCDSPTCWCVCSFLRETGALQLYNRYTMRVTAVSVRDIRDGHHLTLTNFDSVIFCYQCLFWNFFLGYRWRFCHKQVCRAWKALFFGTQDRAPSAVHFTQLNYRTHELPLTQKASHVSKGITSMKQPMRPPARTIHQAL